MTIFSQLSHNSPHFFLFDTKQILIMNLLCRTTRNRITILSFASSLVYWWNGISKSNEPMAFDSFALFAKKRKHDLIVCKPLVAVKMNGIEFFDWFSVILAHAECRMRYISICFLCFRFSRFFGSRSVSHLDDTRTLTTFTKLCCGIRKFGIGPRFNRLLQLFVVRMQTDYQLRKSDYMRGPTYSEYKSTQTSCENWTVSISAPTENFDRCAIAARESDHFRLKRIMCRHRYTLRLAIWYFTYSTIGIRI